MFGAIDIGTNAARLLIGKLNEKTGIVKKICYVRVPIRLGFDVFDNNRISDEKLELFKETMLSFKHLLNAYGVKQYRACATSAMREAENGEQIAWFLKGASGIDVEVISGEEEASLLFESIQKILEGHNEGKTLLIDIGGGSTELTIFEDGITKASKSFQLGTIRLMKHKHDLTVWADIKRWVDENVKTKHDIRVLGAGGNFNKFQKLMGYEPMESIPVDRFNELKGDLDALTVEERMEKYDLKRDRADVIEPACEISDFLFSQLKVSEFRVPKIGISDGIIRALSNKSSD